MLHFNPVYGKTGMPIVFCNGLVGTTAYLKDISSPSQALLTDQTVMPVTKPYDIAKNWYLEYRDPDNRCFNDLNRIDVSDMSTEFKLSYERFMAVRREIYKLLIEQIEPESIDALFAMTIKEIAEHPRIKPQPLSNEEILRKQVHDYELQKRRQAAKEWRMEMNGTMSKTKQRERSR